MRDVQAIALLPACVATMTIARIARAIPVIATLRSTQLLRTKSKLGHESCHGFKEQPSNAANGEQG
jgi:hypothetical protein